MNLVDLKKLYTSKAKQVLQQEAELKLHQQQLETLQKQLASTIENLRNTELVRNLAQLVSEAVRAQTVETFVTLVTSALQAVFEDDLRFNISTTIKRGKPSTEFQVISQTEDGEIVLNPEGSFGDSVNFLIALILRISLCLLYKTNGPILLDEPTKSVDSYHNAKIALFLRTLADQLQRQLIIVTHDDSLAEAAETLITVHKQRGESKIESGSELLSASKT